MIKALTLACVLFLFTQAHAEIFVSTKIDVDGPLPGVFSMRSLASAAFNDQGELLSRFSSNLVPAPGAVMHPHFMANWAKHPQAWEAATKDPRDIQHVMLEYAGWLKALPGEPVFVGSRSIDFMFVFHYLIHYADTCPFAYRALDLRSYAMSHLNASFAETQNAMAAMANTLEDAIAQGQRFGEMKKARCQALFAPREADLIQGWLSAGA